MKLLITTPTCAPQVNGVAEVVRAHAEGFVRLGHDVTIATAFDANRNDSGGANPRVEQFKVTGNAQLGYHGEVERYRAYVANWTGDAVLLHCFQTWSTDSLLEGVLSGMAPRKVMVSHGFIAQRYPLGCIFPRGLRTWLRWQPYVRRLARNLTAFDHVVFLAPLANRWFYYDRLVALRSGLRTFSEIPTGVDLHRSTADRLAFRRRFGITESRMVLCVSEYSDAKNQWLALRAFEQAAIEDAALVFIGGSFNSYSAGLARHAERAALRQQGKRVVLLAGLQRTDVLAAGQASDLSLCPSRWESGPLVVLEAMASRSAFVSTDVGFVSLLPGGVVVQSQSEMAVVMGELLREEATRQRLADAGYAACEKIYNWPAIIARYDLLLRKLIRP